MKLKLMIFALLLLPMQSWAGDRCDTLQLCKRRLNQVDCHKLGYGLEGLWSENYAVAPKVYYEYGSNNGLWSVTAGLKLQLTNPLCTARRDRLFAISLPVYAAAQLHLVRWRYNCFYVGVEADCAIPLAVHHYSYESGETQSDHRAAQVSPSVYGGLGLRLRHLDFALRYGYDLRPQFCQKYIYESSAYDYEALKPLLFDRQHMSLTISYVLPL